MRLLILLTVILSNVGFGYSQYIQGFQQEFFRGNLPDARAEALGRADVAIAERTSSTFMNPAAVCNLGKQQLHYSNSGPYIALSRSRYNAFGISRQLSNKLFAALQINRFNVGPTTFQVNIGPNRYELTKPISSNYALSVGYNILDSLSIAVNANLFNWKLFEEVSAGRTFHFDGGLLYRKAISKNQRIQVGASLTNFTQSTITYSAPDSTEDISPLPVNFRAGVAYYLETDQHLPGMKNGSIDYMISVQYQDIVNNEWLSGIHTGAEAVFHNMFALRLGYYSYDVFNYNNPTVNRSQISEWTYGFGVQLPLDELFPNEGAILKLDYTSLRPPSHTFRGRRLLNFRTFTINLSWPISNES